MINGNPGEFVDRIYSCQDTVFIYNGVKYWFQGYNLENGLVHMEIYQYQPVQEACLWSHEGKTIEECHRAFLEANLFDGKTFWEAESSIEWVDE